jgi:maltose alpha-D-glucosyltransferase/alpha-amylase
LLLELCDQEPPADVFEVVGTALRSAAVLGTRTGEMHLALGSDPSEAAFAPEPLAAAELAENVARLKDHARKAFEALRAKLPKLAPRLRTLAERVLNEGPRLVNRFATLPAEGSNLIKIRVHGDYHLGQVLWAENDFVILDFEGEPGRTMTERRAKKSPLRDVAGMLRSFDYAAYSELLTFSHDDSESFDRLEPWAQIWRTWTSAAFLREYRRAVTPAGLLPTDRDTTGWLLDLYILEKTLFELQYELNYRPDWVTIPLLGVLQLVREASPRPPAPKEFADEAS